MEDPTSKPPLDRLTDDLREIILQELPARLEVHLGPGGGGGGESSGGGSGGLSTAEAKIKSLADHMIVSMNTTENNLSNILALNKDAQDQAVKRFYEQFWNRLQSPIAQLRGEILDTAASLVTMSDMIGWVQKTWRETVELSKTGTVDIISYFKNAVTWGPDLLNTSRLLVDAAKSGQYVMSTTGENAASIGRILKSQRGFMDSYAKLSFGEQNELLLDVYYQLVRQGVRTSLDSQLVRDRANQQYEVLRSISNNTGLTVKEIMEMKKASDLNLDAAMARGNMSEYQRNNLERLSPLIAAMDDNIKSVFLRGLSQFGAGGAVRGAETGELATGLAQSADAIISYVAQGGKDSAVMAGILESVRVQGLDVSVASNELVNGISVMKADFEKMASENKKDGSWIESVARWIEGFVNDWGGVIRIILNGIGGIALGLHTAAMMVHSAALLGDASLLGKTVKIFGAAVSKFGGFISAIVSAIARPVVGVGTTIAAKAYDAYMGWKMGAGVAAGALKLLGKATVFLTLISSAYDLYQNYTSDVENFKKSGYSDAAAIVGTVIKNTLFGIVAVVAFFMGGWVAAIVAGLAYVLDWMTGGAVSQFAGDLIAQLVDFLGSLGSMVWDALLGILDSVKKTLSLDNNPLSGMFSGWFSGSQEVTQASPVKAGIGKVETEVPKPLSMETVVVAPESDSGPLRGIHGESKRSRELHERTVSVLERIADNTGRKRVNRSGEVIYDTY